MALYPNGRYMTSSPGRHFGPAPGLDTAARNRGDRWNRFLSGMAQTTTTPEGYGMRTPWAPIKVGGMAGKGSFAFTIAGNILSGGPMTGTGSFALTAPDASLAMISRMSGSGAWSLVKGVAELSGVVTLTGSGTMSINGQGNLGATVPMSGTGAWSLTGSGDVRMKLSLTGGWTPYTTLSPENLAANVWGALATSFNEAGTMGNKLNSASAAGDPWGADLSSYPAGTAGSHLAILAKINRNKTISDPATGILTVYDDDGVTPLLTAQLYKDAAGTEAYSGTGVERRERLA